MNKNLVNADLKFFPIWFGLGISLVFVVIYLSLTSKPLQVTNFAFSDKIGHLIAYTVLMAWFGQIFTKRAQLILLIVGFAFLGVLMEYLQGLGRYRMFEYADMIANACGVLLGLVLTTTVFRGTLVWVEQRLISNKSNR